MSCHLGYHILKRELFPSTNKTGKTYKSLLKTNIKQLHSRYLSLPLITYTRSIEKNDIYGVLTEEYAEHPFFE